MRLPALFLASLSALAPITIIHAQGAGIEWKALHTETLQHYLAGKHDRARVLAQAALELAEQNTSRHHPDVGTSQHLLADLYRLQYDYAGAESLFMRSLATFEKTHGPDDPILLTSLKHLAQFHQHQSDYAKAEPLLQRALAIHEKAPGADDRALVEILDSLAKVYRGTQRSDEAEDLETRAFQISTGKK